jgi:DNA polymerase-3 subunit epsilon
MDDFVALDLETANSDYASICEIGLVRFSNGIPVDSMSSFVSLPDELDYFENTWIHGITERDCIGAPAFTKVLDDAQRFIGGSPVVAHYTGFDMAAIRKASTLAGLTYPTMDYYCTVVMSRKALRGKLVSFRLQAIADYFQLEFGQEHRAEGDAEAAGKIAAKLMEISGVGSLFDLAKILQVNPGKLGPSLDTRCQTISVSRAYRDLSDEEKARLAELQRAMFGLEELDPSRDFYGKKVVLTGALQSMTRHQAKAVLESVGAIVTDSVSKTTSYVIQGEQKPEEIEAGGSRKEKQAAKLLSEGVDIEVIQEQDFHRLLLD